ncbi:aminopeptidase [Candidatus Falkowbacteria bacterium RIFOXYC2_FULL_47_12]|uniref:M18 family aminopeptidase n=2 Tax=Candidatus Falkowiibacteriota TaxID=1752728 RepID=A0A1F5TQ05_9BACT|nr:MAG: aminopeptidase [Candidatus Falkowbacteria bacterium RIFOXYA2_FULL_47_9]OGF41052.1 MAG: aminopeptidase [Candidatus Falkowbacteria bacterium RIFOXYC2_FULL_47_12]
MPKTNYKKLEEKLTYQRKNVWEEMGDKDKKAAMEFNEGYKDFLNNAKVEREAVKQGIAIAQRAGFKNITEVKTLKTGDKIYAINRDQNILFGVIGKDLAKDGFSLLMSHIDNPRLDLKVNPLYEDSGLVYFKTHYYGGIKKYQWPTIPLALHGVVMLANGKKIEITIGEKEEDPIFMITDLLPHLGKDQLKKTLEEGVTAEELNIVIGSIPVADKKIKEKIKLAILEILNKEYGLTEGDFVSSELHAVTASKARDLGFDRSLVAAFGHDDRVCAYSSLLALLDSKNKERTQLCFWVDREEIGSEGNTSAQSIWIENIIAEILEKSGQPVDFKNIYQVLEKSQAISADVTAAYDPDYKEVHDARNAAYIGCGVALEKYTGHRGKYNSSEASPEYVQKLRAIFDAQKIIWQTGGLGKVDFGGGGTIAMYLAKRNLDVVDMGVGVLNMHAPMEIVSKADVYQSYRAYQAFFEKM